MVSLPFVILFVGSLGLNASLGLPLDIPEILNIIFLVVSFGGLALIGIQLSKDSNLSQSTSSLAKTISDVRSLRIKILNDLFYYNNVFWIDNNAELGWRCVLPG